MVETFIALMTKLNEIVTFWIIFPFIFILGFYFTWKLRGVQFTKLKMSFALLWKSDKSTQGNISHYEAISAVLAGNFGTGNISGMAIAVAMGGPGALVWMWFVTFFGSVIQFASCVLGVKYRQKNSDGDYMGGPMYYISEGLGRKKMGMLYAFFAIIGAFTVGNFTQVNSVTLPLGDLNLDPFYSSLVLAILVGAVILGGMRRFAAIASSVVPVMALLYFGSALIILANHADQVLDAFLLMFQGAFNPESILGGALGYGIVKTISIGFGRAIFATDAGLGLAPIIQSSAKTTHPVIDGIVALAAPFLVMVVCTVTGLVLIVTGVFLNPDLKSTNMCIAAFQKGLGNTIGSYVVLLSLILFAYTTILAWSCCGERAVEFLFGKSKVRLFQYLYIALVPVGALAHVDLVWIVADTAISMMMIVNLIGIAGLSGVVIRKTHDFFQDQYKLSKEEQPLPQEAALVSKD
jgi:AGCS family alanine or glycine:cation symporter